MEDVAALSLDTHVSRLDSACCSVEPEHRAQSLRVSQARCSMRVRPGLAEALWRVQPALLTQGRAGLTWLPGASTRGP